MAIKQTKLDTKERARTATSNEREIIIDIDANGNAEVEVLNAHGECHELTDQLERAIGLIESSEDKDDFYKKQPIVKKSQVKTTG